MIEVRARSGSTEISNHFEDDQAVDAWNYFLDLEDQWDDVTWTHYPDIDFETYIQKVFKDFGKIGK